MSGFAGASPPGLRLNGKGGRAVRTDTALVSSELARSTQPLRRPEGNLRGFSVADLCRRWKVGPDKILGFLRRGELIGVNLATNLSARPQWRITPESVELFELRRSSAPPPKPARRKRNATGFVDYYPDSDKGGAG